MGSLTPGATLIYERANGVTYARESGSLERHVVGYDLAANDPRTNDGRPVHDHMMDNKLWSEIRQAAHTNPALQAALDRAIIIHHLSKKDGQE